LGPWPTSTWNWTVALTAVTLLVVTVTIGVTVSRMQDEVASRVLVISQLDAVNEAIDFLGHEVLAAATATGDSDRVARSWNPRYENYREVIAKLDPADPSLAAIKEDLHLIRTGVARMATSSGEHGRAGITTQVWTTRYRQGMRTANAAVAGATRVMRSEVHHLSFDLSQRWSLLIIVAMISASLGTCAGVMGLLQGRRIARMRVTEVEHGDLKDQLLQAHKMEAVGQLASGTAHDFNNLLTVISGGIDEVAESLSKDHAARRGLQLIQKAAEQAGDVTQALLTFSRKVPTEKMQVNLAEVVRDSTSLLDRIVPKEITLEVNTPAHPVEVKADRTQITQVIMNLGINARDAMPDGGTMTVGLALTGSDRPMACITVTDTGSGLTTEVRARAMEPFFTTKPRGRGTGLGLAIVHGILRDHQGWAELESGTGRGTCVRAFLPCLAGTPKSASRRVRHD
jgi:signal transduction histidine kinase